LSELGLVHPEPDPMLMALAKTWAAIPKKDCPGWAALPVNQKITLQLGSREDRGALMFWLLPQ